MARGFEDLEHLSTHVTLYIEVDISGLSKEYIRTFIL
jgi:hypothetical protein